MIAFAHFMYENLGDSVCSPVGRFEFPDECHDVNMTDIPPDCTVIFGGGGMDEKTKRLVIEAPNKHKIIWGMGINGNLGDPIVYPIQFREFDLVGLRDVNTGYIHTSCPTCMSSLFDHFRVTEPKHDYVVYSHFDGKIELDGPSCDNHVSTGFFDAIKFIASGRVVVTNSYHGAYWAMNLNRRVAIWNMARNKFLAMQYPPPSIHSYRQIASVPRCSPDDFLEGRRKRNLSFYGKVIDVLNTINAALCLLWQPTDALTCCM